MGNEQLGKTLEVPPQNFEGGLFEVHLPPEYGEPQRGKVRDTWVIDGLRFEVTTDRLSAFNQKVCTVPGRGQLLVAFTNLWSDLLVDVISTDIIASPHPNIIVRRQMDKRVPAEVILRDYMAESSTVTSVFRQYTEGRRSIYGINFPDGIRPNEKFPMGTVITPTTKTDDDAEMNDDVTRDLVDEQLGGGVWDRVKEGAFQTFRSGQKMYKDHGIIVADTKFEFGWNEEPILIDEIFTPDSSRLWMANSYYERFSQGKPPINFDKEIIRREMTKMGYRPGSPIPLIDASLRERTLEAYQEPYRMLTGSPLQIKNASQNSVEQALIGAIHRFTSSYKAK